MPRSITRNEIFPRAKADPNYLISSNFKLVASSGAEVKPLSLNWSSLSARSFPYTVVQRPGANNAKMAVVAKLCGLLGADQPVSVRREVIWMLSEIGGFRAIKLGWRPFGRRDSTFDELLVRTARETVGDGVDLLVDAGGSEQFWPHGIKWARRTAEMLATYQIGWFEEPLAPDNLEGYIELRKSVRLPIIIHGSPLQYSFDVLRRAADGYIVGSHKLNVVMERGSLL